MGDVDTTASPVLSVVDLDLLAERVREAVCDALRHDKPHREVAVIAAETVLRGA